MNDLNQALELAETIAADLESGQNAAIADDYSDQCRAPLVQLYQQAIADAHPAEGERVQSDLADTIRNLFRALSAARISPKPELGQAIRAKVKQIRRLLPEEPPAAGQEEPPAAEVQWSKPQSPQDWANLFNCSEKTFKRRVQSGKIQVKKLSSKSYMVDLRHVPKTKR